MDMYNLSKNLATIARTRENLKRMEWVKEGKTFLTTTLEHQSPI